MQQSTTFLLVRHGHAEACDPSNGGARLCGWFDPPLSERGKAQAVHLSASLHRWPRPDTLYCSPLRRAAETASILAERLALTVGTDDGFREIGCGMLDGLLLTDVQRLHPELWARNAAQDDDLFRWPGGESYAEFRARVLSSLLALATRHPGKTVMVVTHSGVISQLIGTMKGLRPAQWEPFRPAHASVSIASWDEGPSGLVEFSATAASGRSRRPGG